MHLAVTPPGYLPGSYEWVEVAGFPSILGLIQTFTPQPAALRMQVPAIPEGLPSADHFDTYWGNVASLPDFTRAQRMACSYPASPPAVGDFLTVADTSPTPWARRITS